MRLRTLLDYAMLEMKTSGKNWEYNQYKIKHTDGDESPEKNDRWEEYRSTFWEHKLEKMERYVGGGVQAWVSVP